MADTFGVGKKEKNFCTGYLQTLLSIWSLFYSLSFLCLVFCLFANSRDQASPLGGDASRSDRDQSTLKKLNEKWSRKLNRILWNLRSLTHSRVNRKTGSGNQGNAITCDHFRQGTFWSMDMFN